MNFEVSKTEPARAGQHMAIVKIADAGRYTLTRKEFRAIAPGEAVGFSITARRRCKGRRQAECAGVMPLIDRVFFAVRPLETETGHEWQDRLGQNRTHAAQQNSAWWNPSIPDAAAAATG